jgi:hypothetical protein
MKYKSKVVEIEAIQYLEDEHSFNQLISLGVIPKVYETHIAVETLEGEMKISCGDFVIKGLIGEFYPCKPEVFHRKYEPTESDT